jgi:hypothetical protein
MINTDQMNLLFMESSFSLEGFMFIDLFGNYGFDVRELMMRDD